MNLVFPEINELTLNMLGMATIASVLIPIVGLIIGAVKLKNGPMPLLYGIVLYITAQLFLVNPIMNLFIVAIPGVRELFQAKSMLSTIIISLIPSAIEETAKYLCLAFFMKSFRKWNDGFMYGFGFGCAEMIIITALTSFNKLVIAAAVSSGAVAELDPASMQEFHLVAVAMAEASPFSFIAAVVDGLSMMILHIALSVLLVEAIKKKDARVLIVTIAIRFSAAYASAVLSGLWKWGFITSTLFLALIAAGAIWYLVKTHTPEPGKLKFKPI